MQPDINLSQRDLAEFKIIYKHEFDETLPDDEAKEIASRLLRLFHILLQPPDISGRSH